MQTAPSKAIRGIILQVTVNYSACSVAGCHAASGNMSRKYGFAVYNSNAICSGWVVIAAINRGSRVQKD